MINSLKNISGREKQMFKRTKLFVCITALSVFISGMVYGHNITVTNMVGLSSGTYNIVPLPTKIKASSDYVPLFRINVTSNSVASPYQMQAVSFTITNVSGFQFDRDISAVALFKDSVYPASAGSTNTWSTSETLMATSQLVMPASGASASYRVVLTLTTPTDGNINNAFDEYTYYIAVKTTAGIPNGTQFSAKINALDDVITTISASTFTVTSGAGSTLTADITPPSLTIAYNPNAATGTSLTVENQDSYNVFSTTDIYISANNTIALRVTLGEGTNSLSDTGIFNLNDLFTLDTSALDGNLSRTKSITSAGGNVYNVLYSLLNTTSTINSPSSPVAFKVKVRDAAGNETAWDSSFNCFIDRTQPATVTLNSPAANAYIGNSAPILSWQPSTDPNHLNYFLVFSSDSELSDFPVNNTGNGFDTLTSIYTSFNGLTGYSGFSLASSTSTVYYWGIVANDKAGNIGLFSSGRAFKYDNIAPNIYSNSPTAIQVISQPSISVLMDDASVNTMAGIDFSSITFKINNQAVSYSTAADVSGTTTTISHTPSSPLTEGTYQVSAWVKDNGGKAASLAWGFAVDLNAPESKDTDNDGYSDKDELFKGSNLNDAASTPANTAQFYPLVNSYESASSFVTTAKQKIKIRINDTSLNPSGGLDIAYTTATAGNLVINHLTRGTTEGWVYLPGESYVGASSATLVIQMTRALSNVGSDDGLIRVSYRVRDNAPNTSSVITRDFYYDTTSPVVSTVTIPSGMDSQTLATFIISAVDNSQMSDTQSDNQMWIYAPAAFAMNMTKGAGSQYSYTVDPAGLSGSYKYFFTVKDKAGNQTVYPPNANSDQSYALTMTISDRTAPRASMYQVFTLLNYPSLQGLTTTFTGTSSMKNIPNLYADPAGDSNDYNLIKATVPQEAVSVSFQYKLSTGASWSSLTANKTGDTVGGNSVWQALWNTSSFATNTYYDIRVTATDAYDNTSTPANNDSAGWAQVYLMPALAPIAKIDSTMIFPRNGGILSGPKVILNADTSTTKNRDISSVKFQYKKLNDPETAWTDIATDSDTTSATKNPTTLYLYESEFPYTSALTGVEISSITSAKFNEQTNGTLYDKEMSRSSGIWQTIVNLPPGTYTYSYDITNHLGQYKSFNQEPRQYGMSGGYARLMINSFSYEWDVTGLTSGESYQVRAVAKDSKNVSDYTPEYITVTYYSANPNAPVITQPLANQRLKPSVAITIKAGVAATDVYISTMVFQYSLNNIDWYLIGKDNTSVDGWSISWTPPAVITDTVYYLRAFAWNHPPAISTAAVSVQVTIDNTAPVIKAFAVEGSTGTVIMNSGSEYQMTATTLDTDISTAVFTCATITGTLTPNSGSVSYKIRGTGTEADPYVYECSIVPTNKNFTYGTITVTMHDAAGNSTAKTINVQVRDQIPTTAYLSRYNNGLGLTGISGSLNYVGRAGVTLEETHNENDGGTVKFQYSSSQTGPWTTISEVNIAGTAALTAFWNPLANGIAEGNYYLRVLATDNDNNIDPAPTVVQFRLDYTEPTVTNLSISPTGTINCANTFTLNAKTVDTDIRRIMFQYYDPANGWVNIDAATAARLIKQVNQDASEVNAVGLNNISYVCSAPMITEPRSLQLRAVAQDLSNNSNTDEAHAPVLTVSFNDTQAPMVTPYLTGLQVAAETNDANIKSVLFQYKVSGSTEPWITLGVSNAANATFGNAGSGFAGPTLQLFQPGPMTSRRLLLINLTTWMSPGPRLLQCWYRLT